MKPTLLLFNLITDVDDPVLGFTTQWINELAKHCSKVLVVTMKAGRLVVDHNVEVFSVGKEKGYSEPRRVLEFYRILFGILREERIDGCFSHMMPLFSALAGPLLRMKRIPLVTWYAHPSITPTLKISHFFSNRIVASLPQAYPYRKNKFSVIGQGIDVNLFSPATFLEIIEKQVLCVGRLSAVKNHPILIRAIDLLRREIPGIKLVILGKADGGNAEKYQADLHALVEELNLGDIVFFAPPVPPTKLVSWYRSCHVHVNLTPSGFGDKVAWEAMSCGRPCLVGNTDFRETLGIHQEPLMFELTPVDLAKKLKAVLLMDQSQSGRIGLYLRQQVIELHSLNALAIKILSEIQKVKTSRYDAVGGAEIS